MKIELLVSVVLAAGVVTGAKAQYYSARDLIRCESTERNVNVCRVDARGGVRLVRQLSRQPCIESQSWGWDRRGIWVSEGCRGEFSVGGGYIAEQPLRCESDDYRQVFCDVPPGVEMRLLRQLSDADCIEGRTWGQTRRGIWVSDGCRAEFASIVRSGRGLPPPSRPAYDDRGMRVVRCESDDRRYRHCEIHIGRGEARLLRQLSDTECRFNRTWGYDRRGIWVDRGCRGEFAIE